MREGGSSLAQQCHAQEGGSSEGALAQQCQEEGSSVSSLVSTVSQLERQQQIDGKKIVVLVTRTRTRKSIIKKIKEQKKEGGGRGLCRLPAHAVAGVSAHKDKRHLISSLTQINRDGALAPRTGQQVMHIETHRRRGTGCEDPSGLRRVWVVSGETCNR